MIRGLLKKDVVIKMASSKMKSGGDEVGPGGLAERIALKTDNLFCFCFLIYRVQAKQITNFSGPFSDFSKWWSMVHKWNRW